MELLYKYYSVNEYSLNNITEGLICFNDLQRFNDPFEGIGDFFYNVTLEEKNYWKSIGSDLPNHISERFADESKETLRFKNRVLSLTSKYDNPLMWSHYANSHTGFCVGYSKDDIFKVCDKLDRITYVDKPNKVNVSQFELNNIESLLFVKSDEWKYEDEWRAIYTLKEADVSHLQYSENYEKCFNDKDSEKIYIMNGFASMGNQEVLEVNKHILKQCKPKVIYLGLKVQPQDREQLLQLAKDKEIEVLQMAQERNSFKMVSFRVPT